MAMRIYLSIIILNVNELNIPIKRHKWQVGFFLFKPRTYNILPTRDSLQGENHSHTLKVRGTGQESIAVLIKTK